MPLAINIHELIQGNVIEWERLEFKQGSRSIKAQGEHLRRLQALAARIPFDDRVNAQAQLDDLNLVEYAATLRSRGELLTFLGLKNQFNN